MATYASNDMPQHVPMHFTYLCCRSSSPVGDARNLQRSSSRAPTDQSEKSASQDRSHDAATVSTRDKSRERPPVSSSRERRSSRERSRERSSSRRPDREQLLKDERPSRHSSRDLRSSGDAAVRSDSRQHDRSDRYRDRDREREHGRYDRERDRYEQYERDRLDRDRHRADSRARDDRRRRSSRSISRDSRLAAPRSFEERERERERAGAKTYEERERERNSHKRSRDDRDRGDDGKVGRMRRQQPLDEVLLNDTVLDDKCNGGLLLSDAFFISWDRTAQGLFSEFSPAARHLRTYQVPDANRLPPLPPHFLLYATQRARWFTIILAVACHTTAETSALPQLR